MIISWVERRDESLSVSPCCHCNDGKSVKDDSVVEADVLELRIAIRTVMRVKTMPIYLSLIIGSIHRSADAPIVGTTKLKNLEELIGD